MSLRASSCLVIFGDLPPYHVLSRNADVLQDSAITHIGPMGVPVGLKSPADVALSAVLLEAQLPGQTFVGLVRGAFLDQIGKRPASLAQVEATIHRVRSRTAHDGVEIPIYVGGFGPKILAMAGRLAVDGVKLGGTVNPALAKLARQRIGNPNVKLVMGAVSVIDENPRNRTAARMRARREVAKYLAVVGNHDATLDGYDRASLDVFNMRFQAGDMENAIQAISDDLLDKCAVAGTPDDALRILGPLKGVIDRFEFGPPHGLGERPAAIHSIAHSILSQL